MVPASVEGPFALCIQMHLSKYTCIHPYRHRDGLQKAEMKLKPKVLIDHLSTVASVDATVDGAP